MSTLTTPAVEHLNERVARELRALQARHGVSQSTLAEVIGVSQSQMSKRLKGTLPLRLDEVQRLSAFFGIKPSQLLAAAEDETSQVTLQSTEWQGWPFGQGWVPSFGLAA